MSILRIAGKGFTFILYMLTILAAFGGRISPSISTLPSVLTLMLPYLAGVTLIVAAAWIIGRRLITGIAGIATLIICWGPVSTVSPVNFPKTPKDGAKTFSVMTYNIAHGVDRKQGGRDSQKGNPAIRYLIDSGADIVVLQELIWWHPDDVPNFTDELRDSLFAAYPYQDNPPHTEMKVISKYPVRHLDAEEIVGEPFDTRRFRFYEVDVNGTPVTIVNMHMMSPRLNDDEVKVVTGIRSVDGARKSYREMKGSIYSKLGASFRKRKEDTAVLRRALDRIKGPVIICGDFNDVPASYSYRLLRGDDIRDAYTDTGFGPMVTYNSHAFWFHIDQILYRGPLRALDVKRGSIKSSDHFPVTAEFELD